MTKAFWTFSVNDGDGSSGNPNRPHLPAGFGGKTTCPGDIIRLQTTHGHKHLLVGGYAIADDNLIGQTGEGHTHLVVKVGDTWRQVTRGAANHTHPLNISMAGNPIPDYFLWFVVCSNAVAAAIASEPGCYPVVEAQVAEGEEGISIGALDNTPWTGAEQTLWESRMLNFLGVQLPPEIDRGKRLVLAFLGSLLSRQTGEEKAYRYSG